MEDDRLDVSVEDLSNAYNKMMKSRDAQLKAKGIKVTSDWMKRINCTCMDCKHEDTLFNFGTDVCAADEHNVNWSDIEAECPMCFSHAVLNEY